MSATINQNGTPYVEQTVGERKVEVFGRGSANGSVSSQWFNRPADQRFLSMDDLMASLERRTMGTREDVIDGTDIRLHASDQNPDDLFLMAPDERPASPTNIAFQQMCGLTGAPYSYLSRLPAKLVAINLQYGFNASRDLGQKVWWNEDTREVRAFTGENYGRILDHALADAVNKIVGDGSTWKVPGVMDWSTMKYNPYVDPTKDTTTLYASDRDVFMFLVDDTHPVEVGKLKDGSPDYLFRGFYAWNSEVGTRSLGIAMFMLRGICCNRMLWGVEGFEEVKLRHSRFAPDRFVRSVHPTLSRYAQSSSQAIMAGVNAAKGASLDEDGARALLGKRKFSMGTIDDILATVEREEDHPATNVWDVVNGITAVARRMPNTDNRIAMEREAAVIMDAATRNRRL